MNIIPYRFFENHSFPQSPDLFEPALHSRSSRIDRPMLGVHSLADHAMIWPSTRKLTHKDKYLHYNGYIPYNGQKRMWLESPSAA